MQIIDGSNVSQLRRPVHQSSFHYKDYLGKKAGWDGTFEDPHGFIAYRQLNDTEMHICDIYIEPTKRAMGIATELADKVLDLAIARGCKILSCRTQITGSEDHLSMLAILHYGFRPVQAHSNEILYMKETGAH